MFNSSHSAAITFRIFLYQRLLLSFLRENSTFWLELVYSPSSASFSSRKKGSRLSRTFTMRSLLVCLLKLIKPPWHLCLNPVSPARASLSRQQVNLLCPCTLLRVITTSPSVAPPSHAEISVYCY
jgi:hypothetical protein